jgi:hypothetical protein
VNDVETFISEKTIENPSLSYNLHDFYDIYVSWCSEKDFKQGDLNEFVNKGHLNIADDLVLGLYPNCVPLPEEEKKEEPADEQQENVKQKRIGNISCFDTLVSGVPPLVINTDTRQNQEIVRNENREEGEAGSDTEEGEAGSDTEDGEGSEEEERDQDL